jgi:hypothetical protein
VGGAPTNEAPCDGKIYQCGDLEDNDGDGLIDYQDPDCLGPCDNTEDSYFPDLPGMSGGPCKLDCFWDNGNGSGNDDCYWDHMCDPLSIPPNYPPEGIDCAYDDTAEPKPGSSCTDAFNMQSDMCTGYCAPLTPNGCDCFGCCEFNDSDEFVWLGSMDADKMGTCTMDVIDDPALCQPCTPVAGCYNDCGECEYCLGKTELPPECFDPGTGGGGGVGGNPGQCPPEFPACGGPGQGECPLNTYCITGCCVPLPQ